MLLGRSPVSIPAKSLSYDYYLYGNPHQVTNSEKEINQNHLIFRQSIITKQSYGLINLRMFSLISINKHHDLKANLSKELIKDHDDIMNI